MERRAKGNGCIRQRKDGRWEGRVTIGKDNAGKRITQSVYGNDRVECESKMEMLMASHGLVSNKPSPTMPFGDWLVYWYKYHCKPLIRPATQAYYENCIYRHIIPEIGHIPLNELTQMDLQQFYKHQKAEGRRVRTDFFGTELSDSIIRQLHITCSTALTKAVNEHLIDINPAKGCKIPPKKSREMNILSHDELERFLIQAKADGNFEFFLLELSTGLRRGELLALQWSDINFRTGELSVTKQVQRINGDLTITKPKTKSSVRTLMIPENVLPILKEYKKSSTSIWLFPSQYNPNLPRSPDSCSDLIRKTLERAECKHVRFHDLRHTFATLALEEGMDVKTLSAILGHVSSTVSLDVYAHSTTKMQQVAASAIDRRISKSRAIMFVPGNMTPLPEKKAFVPKARKYRKSGTGCISKIGENLFEGKYSPKWIDGKKRQFNVYASTRGECEEKLAKMIAETKDELEKLKKATPPKPQKEIKILLY